MMSTKEYTNDLCRLHGLVHEQQKDCKKYERLLSREARRIDAVFNKYPILFLFSILGFWKVIELIIFGLKFAETVMELM